MILLTVTQKTSFEYPGLLFIPEIYDVANHLIFRNNPPIRNNIFYLPKKHSRSNSPK